MPGRARLFVNALRFSLAGCALFLVLVALYVSLGRQLIPLANDYRQQAADMLSQQLDVPVTIDEIDGGWQRFSPLLAFNGIRIGEGERAIGLRQIRLIPSVWESLMAWQLRLSAVEVEGASLTVREQEDGQWRIDGLRQSDEPLDIEKTLRQVLDIHRIKIIDTRLSMQLYDSEPIALDHMEALLANGNRQVLGGRVRLPDGQPIAFSVDLKIKPANWRQSEAIGYLNLPQTRWERWLPERLTSDWQVSTLNAGGDIWWNWRNERLQSGAARLHAPSIQAAYADQPLLTLDNLGVNLFFDRQDDGWLIRVGDLAASLGDTRWGEVEAEVRYRRQNDEEHWQLMADRLDIGPLRDAILALSPLSDRIREWLAGLQPAGVLNQVTVQYWPDRPVYDQVAFSANLEKVSIQPHRQVPGVENVDGTVQGSLRGGTLDAVSQQFGLHLAMMFPQPWSYRQASGRLFWALDEKSFTLGSHLMRVEGEEGHLAGDLLLRIAFDDQIEDYMDLRVSLREGDAGFTSRYLPTELKAMPPGLADWLNQSIRGGHVKEGFFQWQGAIGQHMNEESHTLSLYFDVDDASLDYRQGWPALSEIDGQVFVQKRHVWVNADRARVLDSSVSDVHVDVPAVDFHDSLSIHVRGDVQSHLKDVLSTLQNAPIATQELMAGWSGQGDVQGHLQLDIPLGGGDRRKPGVIVDFSTRNAELVIAQQNLHFNGLQGDFHFDLSKGLSASDVQAQVLGTAVRGQIVAEGRNDTRSRFLLNGTVDVGTLAEWQGLSRHSIPASGQMPFRLDLLIDGERSELQADSDLLGVAIDMPPPFGKAVDEMVQTHWRMTLQAPMQRFEGHYGDRVRLAYSAPSNRLFGGRGELLIGAAGKLTPSDKGLVVRGRLESIDLDQWQETIQRYLSNRTSTKTTLRSSGETGVNELFRYVLLDIDRLEGFGQSLNRVTIDLQRQENAWLMNFASDRVGGRVIRSDIPDYPIQLNLEWLSLPKPAAKEDDSEGRGDAFAEFDPSSLPPIDLTIADISLDGESLGAWRFDIRPTGNGIALENMDLDLRGLRVDGRTVWEGTGRFMRTHYQGQLRGGDLANILRAWDYAPSVTSERFRLDVDGNWPGSPLAIDLTRFNGTLDVSVRRGQFVEIDGSAQALRIFGVLNFNSIGRRLRLDFSDLLDKGLAYDTFKGVVRANEGHYVTTEPIRLKGPSSNLELTGTLDMPNDRIDAKLLVTLPITNNLPLAALIVGAPAVGGALFVANKLLGNQVARFATVTYDVTGSLQDPQINFDRPFEKPQ